MLYLMSYGILCHCGHFSNNVACERVHKLVSSQLTFSSSMASNPTYLRGYVLAFAHPLLCGIMYEVHANY